MQGPAAVLQCSALHDAGLQNTDSGDNLNDIKLDNMQLGRFNWNIKLN